MKLEKGEDKYSLALSLRNTFRNTKLIIYLSTKFLKNKEYFRMIFHQIYPCATGEVINKDNKILNPRLKTTRLGPHISE